jgi:hypothetical protein
MKTVIWAAMALAASIGISGAQENWFNLSFPGGTPKEFVEAVNLAAAKSIREPRPINLLVPRDLTDVKVPPMELRAVTTATLFQSLTLLSRSGPDGLEWRSSSENVWVLGRRPDDRKTQAFYVGNLLQKFKIEDITTAVEATWKLGTRNPEAAPELKYHKDTQLLIARAYQSQLTTMSEVISQLRLGIEQPALPDPKPVEKTR